MSDKAREFYDVFAILTVDPEGIEGKQTFDARVHLIEKSAYEAAIKERDELRDELRKLKYRDPIRADRDRYKKMCREMAKQLETSNAYDESCGVQNLVIGDPERDRYESFKKDLKRWQEMEND